MRIGELHGRDRPVFSFEFFPPKTDQGARNLMVTVADLRDALKPDFVSVTNGAMGATRARTLEVVSRVKRDLGITSMAHLTCVGTTAAQIKEEVDDLVAHGVENILALRGDAPKDAEEFVVTEGGFAHATDLIEFLGQNFELDIGGACYPEVHPESKSGADDLAWTKRTVELGAKFLVTQLFFDNDRYFEFVARARAAGIEAPITPGIMPVTNVEQIKRFTSMCGATIPEELMDRLRRDQDDPAKVMAIGIEHAIGQCRGLLEGGAPGIHFYTLNKSHATRSILAAVRA